MGSEGSSFSMSDMTLKVSLSSSARWECQKLASRSLTKRTPHHASTWSVA